MRRRMPLWEEAGRGCVYAAGRLCGGVCGCEYAGSADPGLKVKPRGSAGRGRGGEELRASPEAGLRVAGA